MSDRVVNEHILREDSFVRTLHFLRIFSKSLKPEVLFILVLNLASDNVHFLIVVFVGRLYFLRTLIIGGELTHRGGFICDGRYPKVDFTSSQICPRMHWLRLLETNKD